MMKVALYARVSMDEGSDDRRYQEPENQLVPLRDWANALGYEIVAEYVDRASGANPARPEFRRMMSDAMQRKFNGILIWRLDRFSREGVIPTMAYLKQLQSRGVFLKSLTESWLDTKESITEVVLAVMAWAAAEERKRISDRTKAAISRLKAIGQWKGGRPLKNIPDDLKAAINDLYASGKSSRQISRKLKVSKEVIDRHIQEKKGGADIG